MALIPNRRAVLAAIGATGLAGQGWSAECPKSPGRSPRLMWTDRKAFASGPLARSWIAARFNAPSEDFSWPDTPILGVEGSVTPKAWAGKTVLLTLWAEWCAPCLVELPALAGLNARYGGKSFAIVPIATSSQVIHAPADAARILSQRQAGGFPPLIDGSPNGRGLMDSLALVKVTEVVRHGCPAKRTNASLPCLVVIDPQGRVRGRALGLPSSRPRGNVWQEPAGEAFIKLLADGALADA